MFSFIRTIINTVFTKAQVGHVRETSKTNNGRKNSPISKYHNEILQKFKPILARPDYKGQSLVNEKGFSLIEVMVAAGILGALSYAGMQLMDQFKRGQKQTEERFEVFDFLAEKKSILSSDINCMQTFEGIDVKKLTNWKDNKEAPLEITSLKKVIFKKEEEPEIRERFIIGGQRTTPKISQYSLFKDEEDFIEDDLQEANLNLQITYLLKDDYQLVKRIPMVFKFDYENPKTLISCHSLTASQGSSGGQMIIIDPLKETDLKGKSGFDACKSKDKSCQYVSSLNYASQTYGTQSGLSNLCQINYNQPLKAVKQGSPVSNIHSCDALLDQFKTYELNQKDFGVTCQGIFMAHCQ